MPQLKIAQVTGLVSALLSKVDTIVYGNSSQGYAQLATKTNNVLTLASLVNGNGLVGLTTENNQIEFAVDVGVTANKIVQLDSNGQLGPIDARQLINLNPSSISTALGTYFPLSTLQLPLGEFYVGNAFGNPMATLKSSIPLSGFGIPTSEIDLGAQVISTTASSFTDTQLVTKAYVSSVLQGTQYKVAAVVAPPGNVNIASPPTTLDGYTAISGDRILLMNQTNSSQNGVYQYAGAGNPMARTSDCETPDQMVQMAVFVSQGTNAYSSFLMITPLPLQIDGGTGASGLLYTQISSAGQINAGAGLSKSGSSLLLDADNITVKTIGGAASVVSSNIAGQVLLSTGFNTQAAAWGALNLALAGATTGTLPINRGGTGLAALLQNSVLASVTADNTPAGVLISPSSLLGRTASGNIQAMFKSDIQVVLQSRKLTDTANATAGNMTLITLSQVPDDITKVQMYFNSLLLTYNVDYYISGQTVTASNALNVAYGGTTNNGQGFASTDIITAIYTY